ncbi:TPR repeat [Pedobacter steynii]|uniref:TPR repeat n=1 Tax=Pedobacter steynii TaxID=430522 RepID=A0A1H0GJ57_9SPHI|nr:SEL1-like repeat protein [Pedobacter steynii]NQX42438.1 SEL1-like repeat protein [Pedobacter steynii]SDO06966.1 TPR repeat [Pedobacter steynii]
MSLKTTYTTFQQNAQHSDLPLLQDLQKFTKDDLKNPEVWHQAFAFLEHGTGLLPANNQEVFALYEMLFMGGLDFKASVYLDEADYNFHLDTVINVLEQLAIHFPVAYSQIAFQYREARGTRRDPEKMSIYLDKAIENKVELAVAVKGYLLYYGVILEKDEETGLHLLNSSDSVWNKLYRGYISINKGEMDDIPALIAALKETNDPLLKKNVLLFEGNYLDHTEQIEAAKSLYQQLVDTDEADFAMFRLGSIIFSQSEEPVAQEAAFELWKSAFERGTIEAANHLGYHSLPTDVDTGSVTQAIYWFELGNLYHSHFSAYRLALLYLYAPSVLDAKKGMYYLDQAIKNGSLDAMIEKAEILIEGALAEKNEQEAGELLKKAAEKKLPYAFNRLGYLYENGIVIADTPDLATALSHYEQAAALNFPTAINNAARFYRYGILGEPHQKKAQEYFEKGVALNSTYSMTELAFMYEDGTIEESYQKAFDLFNQAAGLDYPFAIHTAGTYLENGYHNQNPDPEAAFPYYLKGAELNYANCQFEVGRCYRFGTGIAENPDKALEYYLQAAEGGNAKAMVELGLCYEHEYGVEFDAQKAFDYMQQAADLGYYYGAYKLGYYYMHGLIEKDTEKALQWLEKAAEAGYPHAMIEIGDYYMYDYDQIDQADKAFGYYQKALEGEIVHEGLGLCYEYGIGVEANNSEAFKYYEMAANNNYVVAMYHTGRCYLNGLGVKENHEEAFRWFNEAAQSDNTSAQYYAGSLLLNGKGVTMNKEQGIEWLNKAAAEEHATAQFDLGNCYLMGDGVEESEDTAMYWFEKAADNGHERAMKLTGRKKGK